LVKSIKHLVNSINVELVVLKINKGYTHGSASLANIGMVPCFFEKRCILIDVF
tara:strand:+ start:3601 stop:3759 length:159 start_codon:yes stop_codon:yes gene_type:complete